MGGLVKPNKVMSRKKYIGVKILNSAKLMTKVEYCRIRNWDVPKDEDPQEEGYLVEYEPDEFNKPNMPGYEGYVSWSPKEVFEKAYRPMKGMGIGLAIEALNKGLMVSRVGWWADKRYFVFKQVPSSIFIDKVENMQSLPKAVKDEFSKRFGIACGGDEEAKEYADYIKYSDQLAIVDNKNNIKAYTPSVEDVLAEDWYIVE